MAIRRRHWFELEDQPWWPGPWREMMTDFLRTSADVALPYDRLVPLLQRGLASLEHQRIIDLCAGAGGAPQALQRSLAAAGKDVDVLATDLFPNVTAFERMGVPHVKEPVDATAVPAHLGGLRTVFNALHHFRPDMARAIFADAAKQRQSLLVIETVRPHPVAVGMMFFVPFITLVLTPLMRPFRWDRLLWTYLLPVVPLACGFDGLMSCLRSYTLPELDELTHGLDHDGTYAWETGRVRVPFTPIDVFFVLGYPTL